jgi:hypothetical protein
MDVNKIQIMKDGFTDKELVIPIELTWDYLGLDQSIDEYEGEIIKKVTGGFGDFEVNRFAHAPTQIQTYLLKLQISNMNLIFIREVH